MIGSSFTYRGVKVKFVLSTLTYIFFHNGNFYTTFSKKEAKQIIDGETEGD